MGAMQKDLREMQVIGRNTREWIVHRQECPPLGALGLNYAGVTQAANGFAFCRLKPDIAVIFGTVSGRGRVWVEGKWRTCRRGDIYLAPAGVPHAYAALPGQSWRLGWAAYEGATAWEILQGQARLRRDSALELQSAILGLYHEVRSWNQTDAAHHWAGLVDLSAQRLRHEQRIDERVRRFWSDVELDLGQPWTLAALARRAHLGPEQLRHLCQRDLGRSPMAHLAWLRMRHAAVLLVRTDQKIATIAEEVGYENPFAFSTAFKRIVGMPPIEFSRGRSST